MTPSPPEAQRRVNEACDLITSAVRLGNLDAALIVRSVRVAIDKGMEQLSEDMREEARGA